MVKWKWLIRWVRSRMPRRKSVFFLAAFFACTWLFMWQTKTWHIFYYFYYLLPEERGWLPIINEQNETLQCNDLLRVARRLLDGEMIQLPYTDERPLWSFKERASRAELLRSLNYAGNHSDDRPEVSQRLENHNTNAEHIKGKKLFITFGHNCCRYSKQRALQQARTIGGFDYVHSFNMDSLTLKFRQTHQDVLRARRGAGYWLWKPYILLKTLVENMAEGDLVMYQDAGAYLIRSASPLFKLCQKSQSGIILFSLDTTEQDYTKKDAMVLMNMDISEVQQSPQRLASFVVLRKNCDSIQFVMEWLAYLSDRRIASDDKSTMGLHNAKSFIAHRHDQSVLSLLSKKWGIPAMRDPSGHGLRMVNIHNGPYNQLIIHDRFKH